MVLFTDTDLVELPDVAVEPALDEIFPCEPPDRDHPLPRYYAGGAEIRLEQDPMSFHTRLTATRGPYSVAMIVSRQAIAAARHLGTEFLQHCIYRLVEELDYVHGMRAERERDPRHHPDDAALEPRNLRALANRYGYAPEYQSYEWIRGNTLAPPMETPNLQMVAQHRYNALNEGTYGTIERSTDTPWWSRW